MLIDPPGECKHWPVSLAATFFTLQSIKTVLLTSVLMLMVQSNSVFFFFNNKFQMNEIKMKRIRRGNTQWPCSGHVYSVNIKLLHKKKKKGSLINFKILLF